MGDAMKFEPEFTPQNPYLAWLCHRLSGWQFGEQGLLREIVLCLSHAGAVGELMIEIGAGDGCELPLNLDSIMELDDCYGLGFTYKLFEIDSDRRKLLSKKYCDPRDRVEVHAEFNPHRLASDQKVALAIIDIDGKDSVVMRQMLSAGVHPDILMVEHMDRHYPIASASPEPLPEWALGLKLASGHSLQDTAETLHAIAAKSGYERVGFNRCNSVFVRRDLYPMLFRDIGAT